VAPPYVGVVSSWGRARVVTALAVVLAAAVSCGSDDPTDPTDQPAAAGTPSETPSPSGSSAPEATPDPDDPPIGLFFGDSYVVGGGYTDADSSMAALAATELGWEYHIAGGGGTGFATGNEDFDLPPYPEQIDGGALDVGPVDWVVVEGGGNDDGMPPDVVTDAAVDTLEAAADLHPEARVVLVASMDPTVEDFSDTDGVTGALEDAAAQVGVPFVDGQRWLEGRPELIGPDFDHPLPAGHQLCGRRLAEALRSLV
jgi:lysophospholipase L1-like esterase